MEKLTNRYTYQTAWSAEDGEFIGICAEFPSLSWLAPSPDEAFAGIRRVVADCAEDMSRENEPLPEPAGERATALRIANGG